MKVLLYPFSDAAGIKKYMEVFAGWSDSNKACFFVDPSDAEYKPLSYLASGLNHTIYVLGHCASGGICLRSEESYVHGDKGEVKGHTLRAGPLIDVFKALGMHDNVSTRLKCLNCHSGQHFEGFVHLDAFPGLRSRTP
jgi:hypothetical protein